MQAGLGGPAGRPRWMPSGPPPAILILADDFRQVPTATRNVPRSPRGCHRPGARLDTSDGGRGSPRRGVFSCTACFSRGHGTSGSNRFFCVRERADRARLRTRGSASGWGPCSTFLCVFFALPWGVHGGRGEGVPPPSRYQATRVVVVPVRRRFGALLRPFPRRWLHRLQMVRPLSSVLVPPSDHGVMWSGSGLSGWRLVSHASVTPQVGHVVCPAARSRLRTAARHRLCPVVPVLLVVMVGGGWLLAGGVVCGPPPAGVVRRGGHSARGRCPAGFGGWGGGCWRAHRARGRGAVP